MNQDTQDAEIPIRCAGNRWAVESEYDLCMFEGRSSEEDEVFSGDGFIPFVERNGAIMSRAFWIMPRASLLEAVAAD